MPLNPKQSWFSGSGTLGHRRGSPGLAADTHIAAPGKAELNGAAQQRLPSFAIPESQSAQVTPGAAPGGDLDLRRIWEEPDAAEGAAGAASPGTG